MSQRCSSPGLHIRSCVRKNNGHPRLVLASSVFHLKSNEIWGKVCHTSSFCHFVSCEKMGVYIWLGGSFLPCCCCFSNFSVIYQAVLLCFLPHLVPDHADLQCCFHESRLITSMWPGLNGETLTPRQHLTGNSLCWAPSGRGLPQRRKRFLFAQVGRQQEEE